MPPTDDDVDPCVTQEMVTMGFQRDQIKDALKKKTYNKVMATYLMLNTKQPKVQCRKILVRPVHSCDLDSSCPSPAQEVEPERSGLPQAEQQPKAQESGQKAEESAGPSARSPGRPPPDPAPGGELPLPDSAGGRGRLLPVPAWSGVRIRNCHFPPKPELRNATPSPPSQCGPGDSTSPHSTGSPSSSGTSKGTSQGQCAVVRRCLAFLRKLCLRPSKKGHGKRNRVKRI